MYQQQNNAPQAANKPLGWVNLDETINPEGYEVAFAYTDVPQAPLKRNQSPTFSVTVALTQEEAQNIVNLLEQYNVQIDAMYPNTQRKQDWFKPETTSKTDKTPTGRYLLKLANTYPIKVFDANNNQVLPAPRVTRGSRVFLNFGVLPYELNGEHGIARTRLSAVKVLALGESTSSNPFGASTGEQVLEAGHPAAAPMGHNPMMGHQPVAPQMGGYAPNPMMPQMGHQPVAPNPMMPPMGHMQAPQAGGQPFAQTPPATQGLVLPAAPKF